MKTAFDTARNHWRVTYQENQRQHRKSLPREADARQFELERREFLATYGQLWTARALNLSKVWALNPMPPYHTGGCSCVGALERGACSLWTLKEYSPPP